MTMTRFTQKQATDLVKGDIISRYPYNGLPRKTFDSRDTALIEVYEVRSINSSTRIVELVVAPNDMMLLPMPGEVSRIFIHENNLCADRMWWTDK